MAISLDDLRQSPARRRFEAMYGTRASTQDETQLPYLPQEQVESQLAWLTRNSLNTAEAVAKTLDYPGAIARGILAGKPLSGFSWDSDTRVSGKELLEQYGLLNKKANPYLAYGAGLAAEIALDPLAPLTGPLRSLTMAGRAGKAAGLLADAPYAALLKMGNGSLEAGAQAARQSRTGRAAYKFLGDLLPNTAPRGSAAADIPKALSPENLRIRPLVGPRVAQSMVTLEEAVKASSDPNALTKVKNYLETKGVDYDSVKGQNLGGALGFNYFGLHEPLVWNPKAAGPVLDALDAIGQAGRWSPIARAGSRLSDPRVDGEYGAAEQFFAIRRANRVSDSQAAFRQLAGRRQALLADIQVNPQAAAMLGADTLSSSQGNDFLTRMYEGAQTASDMRLRNLLGANKVDALVSNWRDIEDLMYDSAKSRGMKAMKRKDLYGVRWSPRTAKEAEFGEYGTGMSRARYSSQMLENEARKRYLMTPGGTVDIRELSMLPSVRALVEQGEKSGLSFSDVGADIKRYLDQKHGPGAADPRVNPFKTFVPKIDPATGKPMVAPVIDPATGAQAVNRQGQPVSKVVYDPTQVITQQQGERIARFLSRKGPDRPADLRMFDEFANVTQARSMDRAAQAYANVDEAMVSMAEAAMHAGAGRHANTLPGARLKPLDQALNEVANAINLPTVAKNNTRVAPKAAIENLQREIARRNNIADWTQVRLSEYALPESVYNRLTRVNDFYSSPRLQQSVRELFDGYTNVFKAFALAFPATKVRDMYSNLFLVWLETGSPSDIIWGYKAANAVLRGNYDEASSLLKEIPGYNLANPQAIRNKVVDDVAGTGVLRSLSTNDLLTTNRTGELNQLMPGSSPVTPLGFMKHITPDGSRTPYQMLRDQFDLRGVRLPFQKTKAYETKNAMLNAFEDISTYIDSSARLAGMFALMKQGVSAGEAAKRITSALVDYSSLTGVERNVLRRLLPWYAYVSRSGKYLVTSLIQNPGGKFAQSLRASRTLQESDDETYIPEAMRQQLAVRVPDAMKPYLGIPQGGNTTTFFKDFDIPGVDVINMLGLAPSAYGTVQSTMQNVSQQAHPFIRTALELATGQDSFSRRPLDQAVTPADRIYRSLTGSKTSMNPLVKQAINLIPGPQQRLISVAGGLSDDRIPLQQRVAKQAFNAFAGIKLQDVDPEWQLQDARRRLSQNLSGYMQDYTESYVPKDVLPQLPQELLPDYLLFRTLGKQLRDERKKERAQ